MPDQATIDAAAVDARLAETEYDDAQAWLHARSTALEPLAAEVWVTDPEHRHVLLVRHRVRGWVPPGGTVEPGETPRAAAARELLEETGLLGELLSVPAAVAVRSFRADWTPTLSLSYGAVINRDAPLGGEKGQPPKWVDLTNRGRACSPRIATESARMCAGSRQSTRSRRADPVGRGFSWWRPLRTSTDRPKHHPALAFSWAVWVARPDVNVRRFVVDMAADQVRSTPGSVGALANLGVIMAIRRDALAARREALGFTQETLAQELGVELSTT